MDKKDAIKCLNTVKQWIPDWDDREDGLSYWDAIDMAIAALSPPNEPLTLEQLLEMDGEPVYLIVDDGYEPLEMWALIDVPEEDHIVLINNIGGRSAYYSDDGLKQDHITVYRRPPEGEADAWTGR